MAKLKAAADIMLLIGMFIGIFLVFFDFTPAWTEGDLYKVTLHSYVYGSSNALEAAELYAEASLDYSLYQALYTTLDNGGFLVTTSSRGSPGLILWRDPDSGLSPPSDEEAKEAIKEATEANLKKYTSEPYRFGDDFLVVFPEYDVALSTALEEFSAATESKGNPASVTKKTEEYGMREDIVMDRRILPGGTYGIDYSTMLDLGRSIDTVQIHDEIEAIFRQYSLSTLTEAETRNPINESIKSMLALKSLSGSEDYSLAMEVHNLKVSGSSSPDGNYSFNAAVIVKNTITYDTEAFPVYSSEQGKLVMDNIRLVFHDRYTFSFHS